VAVSAFAPAAIAAAQDEAGTWEEIAEAHFATQLASCPAAVRATVAAAQLPGPDEVRYARLPPWVRRTDVSYGDGLDGSTHMMHHLIELRSCFEVSVSASYENSSPFEVRLTMAGSDAPAPRVWAELALGMPIEMLRPGDPRHALPQLLVELEREQPVDQNLELHDCPAMSAGAPRLSEPLMPAQPWLPGPPRRWPTVWVDGYVMFASAAAPRRAWRGPDAEMWEVNLPSRYRAVAVAQYDRRLDRHRWLLVTRWCAVGRVHWLGQRREWVLAAVHGPSTEQGPELIAIHLQRGDVRRLWWPALRDEAGLPRARALCDGPGRVTLDGCSYFALRRGHISALLCGPYGCQSSRAEIDSLLSESGRANEPVESRESRR